MSVCNPCTKTLPVLYCSDTIYVADWIAGAGVDVQVWWMNTATGRLGSELVTTGVSGKVAINFVGKMEGSSYELWINETVGQLSVKDSFYLPNTVVSTDCVNVTFSRAYDDGLAITVVESTLDAE